MRVRDIMKHEVSVCSPDTDLVDVARTMNEVGCGILPVVEQGQVVGVVTDRDVCLAIAEEGRPPRERTVREIMSKEVHDCRPHEDVRDAMATMRHDKVRRLPVVDETQKVVGLLSLDDVVLEARAFESTGFDGPLYTDIALTLKAICEHDVPAIA